MWLKADPERPFSEIASTVEWYNPREACDEFRPVRTFLNPQLKKQYNGYINRYATFLMVNFTNCT
jgi:hypothetical protein